jgi:uncharacterized protein (DUF362 family)
MRRALLAGTFGAAVGAIGYPWLRQPAPSPSPKPRPVREKAATFIARNQTYNGPLARTIRDGLIATGIDPAGLRGRNVLLKPNMVEPSRLAPHVSTHPSVVVATAEVFQRWGAKVLVGEGPGHMRDTEWALLESGIGEALDTAGIEFFDLNYGEVVWSKNAGGHSPLRGFHLPRRLREIDLIVSLPKLKTHHWMGMTASLKNLYGLLPGIAYGWPKNVLHYAGIPQTVVDIYASLPRTIAVVDAIECMEGDGPIMGEIKPMGLIVVGANLPAVDATCARVMGLVPWGIPYLRLAEGADSLDDASIVQRAEPWRVVASDFRLPERPLLQGMRRAAMPGRF